MPETCGFSFMIEIHSLSALQALGKLGGAWVFRGTRVPVTALFENLEDGATVDDFLSWFPGVQREQIEAVLDHASRSLDTLITPV